MARGVGIDAQMPLPSSLRPLRKVSFDLHDDRKETPIKPPTRILPPKPGTPKAQLPANLSTPTKPVKDMLSNTTVQVIG